VKFLQTPLASRQSASRGTLGCARHKNFGVFGNRFPVRNHTQNIA